MPANSAFEGGCRALSDTRHAGEPARTAAALFLVTSAGCVSFVLPAGNGFVLESVNNVLRVYDAATGNPLLAAVDHFTFYDYPPQFDEATQGSGDDVPKVRDSETESIDDVSDPMCAFDEDSRRWFHTVLRREVQPDTGHPIGPTSLDIAVSDTADPRGEAHTRTHAGTPPPKTHTHTHNTCSTVPAYEPWPA